MPDYEIGKPYSVIARHAKHDTQNRMHADGLPQKLGFRGALVLGLATYGNMTRALVARHGERWLGCAVTEVQFLKPICEGDRLRIETLPVVGRESEYAYQVIAYNETVNGEPSVKMQTSMPAPLPEIDPHARMKPIEWEGPVTQRRTWESVVVDQPYRSCRHTIAPEDNAHWQNILGDDLQIYRQGSNPPAHPTHVLRQVQIGYNNQYVGDNAIHSATKAVIRRMLRVGDSVEILTVPIAKWEKKQNHWMTIYAAVRCKGEVCAEIYHTQIFKVRNADRQ